MSSNAIEKDCFIMLRQVQMWRAMCTDACRKRITSTIIIDYGKFILMMFIAETSFKLFLE